MYAQGGAAIKAITDVDTMAFVLGHDPKSLRMQIQRTEGRWDQSRSTYGDMYVVFTPIDEVSLAHCPHCHCCIITMLLCRWGWVGRSC